MQRKMGLLSVDMNRSDIKILEKEQFTVVVNEKPVLVEFQFQLLPNDMKMLCFLGGELSNAAKCFTTFANVNQDDANDVTKNFNMDGSSALKPFSYKQRLKNAESVSKKKSELQKKNIKPEALRQNITTFITKQLKSRQETVPLLENYIDKAKCEHLHLKNNFTKELLVKCMNHVLVEAKVPASIKCFQDIHPENS